MSETTDEKKIELIEFTIEMEKYLFDFLVKFGMSKIKEDKEALANYGMNIILKEKLKELNLK